MQHPAGASPPPAVSVVLCVRNGAEIVERQLAALSMQEFDEPWELVFVDNGSTDGTAARASAWASHLPSMHLLAEVVPGLNRARNRGVGAARGRRILCCDADDEVAPRWIGAMVAALERVDIVGGALEPYPHVLAADRWFDCPQTAELPTQFDEPYAVGANLGFTRDVFDAVGGFDDAFDTGADEVDFCLRARQAGYSIGFAPDAAVRYAVKETPVALMRQRFGYGRGHQRLLAKFDRLHWLDRSRKTRWRDVSRSGASLLLTSPQALRADTRSEYLARLAHVAGEATELALPARDA